MNDNNVISFYILKELLNSFQTSGNETINASADTERL